ncbi:MAG: ComEC/Rec2 family competence protein [Vampirovibrionales bacterium]|nr:ComEC/Rec2 family competence protein [Vampirovibrionales bacterium]
MTRFTLVLGALCVGWIFGIALGVYHPAGASALGLFGTLGLVCFACALAVCVKARWMAWFIAAGFACLVGLNWAIWREQLDYFRHPLVQLGQKADFETVATVYSPLKAGSAKHWLHLSVPHAGWVLADVRRKKIQAQWPQVGARVRLHGQFRLGRRPIITSGLSHFDEHAYLRSLGAIGVIDKISRIEQLDAGPVSGFSAVMRSVDALRARLTQPFIRQLGPQAGAIAASMIFGERAVGLDKPTRDAFAQTGLIHLLAASGMNVGIVAASVFGLLAALGCWINLPRSVRFTWVMLSVGAYMLITGMPPSILRAGTMLLLALALKWRNRRVPAVLLLLSSVSLLLCVQPQAVQSLGLQLSVATTLGILSYASAWQKRLGHRLGPTLALVLFVPVIAQLWATPLLLPVFNQLPLLSAALNLPAAWFSAPVTGVGALIAPACLLLPGAEIMLRLLQWPVAAIQGLAFWGQAQQWAFITLPSWPWFITVAWLALLCCWGLWFAWQDVRRPLPKPGRVEYARTPAPAQPYKWGLVVLTLGLVASSLVLMQPPAEPQVLALSSASQGRVALVRYIRYARRDDGPLGFLGGFSPYARVMLPADTRYWEARALADELKHRNVNANALSVKVLPPTQASTLEATAPESELSTQKKPKKTPAFKLKWLTSNL